MIQLISRIRKFFCISCILGVFTTVANATDISVQQTVALIQSDPNVVLLDIRENIERQQGYIPSTIHLPMGQIQYNLDKLPRDKKIVLTCRTGNRTGQMARLLRQQGFDNVYNMVGGIVAWAQSGQKVVMP
ncbi:rhodanese-like domain-containing protein [Chrysiogenes arsenatis]|uniref:rhodanese-like domain-containing protein n=1 Tax=Chrysiogenes arsenatis TaxID=309797 RepID=UPI000425740E|nr:rhodanese-like domain-containing protein [Chrysiogenes arsenatis]